MDDAGRNPPACPECGAPASERAVPKPSGWTHWRTVVPLVAVLIALAAIAAAFWQGRQLQTYGQMPPYVGAREFVRPHVTLRDLRDIAAGSKRSDGSLTRAVLDRSNPWLVRPPGEEFLVLRLHPEDGPQLVNRRFGWPGPLVTTQAAREMVQGKTPPLEARADLAPRETYWAGGRITTLAPSSVGSTYRDFITINITGIAGMLVIPVAAWYAAGLAMRLFRRSQSPRGRNTVRVAAAAVALLCLALLAARADESISETPGSFATPSYTDSRLDFTHVTSLTYRQVAEMGAGPDADRRLASELLRDAEGREDWLLCVSFVEDSSRVAENVWAYSPWPLFQVHNVQRWRHEPVLVPEHISFASGAGLNGVPLSTSRPPASPAPRITWPAAGAICQLRDGELQIALPRFNPTQELRAVMISLDGVLFLALVLWLVWIGARLLCARRASRMTHRRIAANQCVVCGYSLAGMDA